MNRPTPATHHLSASALEAAAAGDERAFVSVIKRHDDGLRAFTFSMLSDRRLMDQVLRETYLTAFMSMDSRRHASSLKAWLFGLAYGSIVEELHHRPKTWMRPGAVQPGDVNAALATIPPLPRAALLLLDGEGLDYLVAAEVLNMPLASVKSHAGEGRRRFTDIIGSDQQIPTAPPNPQGAALPPRPQRRLQ